MVSRLVDVTPVVPADQLVAQMVPPSMFDDVSFDSYIPDPAEPSQAAAVKEVRDQAVVIAVAAARDVIAKQMTAAEGNALIDSAIAEVDAKLH